MKPIPAQTASRALKYSRFARIELLAVFGVALYLGAGITGYSAIDGITPPAHVVIVIEENKAYEQIIGSASAPYINGLTNQGALFTQYFALEHPSEPNYLDLFSGSNQGVTDDSCPHSFTTANLGAQLLQHHLTFRGYAEGLPAAGSTVCTSGAYARKHCPWINWQGTGTNQIPATNSLPGVNFPITDFNQLPTLCFLIPNLDNDMHDGTTSAGDTWLRNHLDNYVQWAKTNNSLFILTWDEDNRFHGNHIVTLFVGQMVKTGRFEEHVDNYDLLRTIEDLYGLPHAGNAATATTITNVWQAVSASVPQITNINVSGTTLMLRGTNGGAGNRYVLLGSTNAALPLNQWTPLLTNYFDTNGNLNLSTDLINPWPSQQLYILELH